MRKTIATITAVLALAGAVTACEVPEDSSDHPYTKTDQNPNRGDGKSKKADDLTTSQEQAIGAAQDYLDLTGFSRDGLIQQLSSPAGDGFKKADATFAVDHLKVDWNAEAVEAAKGYLDLTHFSRDGLIQQLTSDAGDGFTVAQATYAADKVGL